MTDKLLSDEELIDEISKIQLDTQIAIIDEYKPLLDLINTQKRLYAESVEVDVRLDEINRAVSHKYEHPSGRFIGRGKYYGRRTDELDAELRAEQRRRIK